MEKAGIDVYLGLGSNEGDREANIRLALSMLDDVDGVNVVKVSDLIETEPWGFNADVKFLNCAAEVFVNEQVTPLSFLKECKRIEKKPPKLYDLTTLQREANRYYGMTASQTVYHSRPIDIDILLYGKQHIDNEILTIPHPLMSERDFVMIPLRQIVSEEEKEAFPEVFKRNR